MPRIRSGLVLAALAAVAVMVGIRSMSVPAERYSRTGPIPEPGDHAAQGGFIAVRRMDDPKAGLSRLAEIATAAPRTRALGGSLSEGHLSFVTRSAIWGFPDVTNIWIDGDRLAIRGRQVIGKTDFGVNRRRIEQWLAQAGLAQAA